MNLLIVSSLLLSSIIYTAYGDLTYYKEIIVSSFPDEQLINGQWEFNGYINNGPSYKQKTCDLGDNVIIDCTDYGRTLTKTTSNKYTFNGMSWCDISNNIDNPEQCTSWSYDKGQCVGAKVTGSGPIYAMAVAANRRRLKTAPTSSRLLLQSTASSSNLLCGDSWTAVQGTWRRYFKECALYKENYSWSCTDWLWFGSNDGATPSSGTNNIYNSNNFKLEMIFQFNWNSGATIGLMYRVRKLEPQYGIITGNVFYLSQPSGSETVGSIKVSQTGGVGFASSSYPALDQSSPHKLTIIASDSGNKYYIDDNEVFVGETIPNIKYDSSTIGLTASSNVFFHSLSISAL